MNDDCTIGGTLGRTALKTGKCQKSRCVCTHPSSWGGPRCTTAISSSTSSSGSYFTRNSYGPPIGLSIAVAAVAAVAALLSSLSIYAAAVKEKRAVAKKRDGVKSAAQLLSYESNNDIRAADQAQFTRKAAKPQSNDPQPKDNYSQNFV